MAFSFMHRHLKNLVLLLPLLAMGCAPLAPYQKIEGDMQAGQFDQAAQEVESSQKSYGGSSRLLYLMDRAETLHLAGDYAQSNQALEQANGLIADLYTKSLSKEAFSFMLNDTSLDYVGEDFEKVWVNILGMLNYVFLDKPEEALVEARRADERLSQYARDYGDKAVYREDALARYLSAVLYESQGQLSDAYIDYKKCRQAFQQYAASYGTPEPAFLGSDLCRLSQSLGYDDDFDDWKSKYPSIQFEKQHDLNGKGEVLLLLYDGLAPAKTDDWISIPIGSLIYKLAFPKFVSRPDSLGGAALEAPGPGLSQDLSLMEDVDAIAVKDLQARIGRISVKAIARATAKFAANAKIQEEAKNSGDPAKELLAFFGTNLYTLVTEQADKRSWRTLPGRIYLTRMALEPGTYDLFLHLRTAGGDRMKVFRHVVLEAGKKAFLKEVVY
jgi:hypothetical protein